jgi:Integral membrane protein EMC3/TMCO1-like
MTCTDISSIFVTVAVTQLLCDLVAHRFVYSSEAYERAMGRLSRIQYQHDKLSARAGGNSNSSSNSGSDKKWTRAVADLKEARSDVTKMHFVPQVLSSLVFVVLYKILAAEHVGHVVGVLPFVPWKFFQKITLRGIDFGPTMPSPWDATAATPPGGVTDPAQGCAFLLIYLLCTMSIKFYIHQAVAVQAPKGADGGIMTVLEDPKSQKILKAWGLDNETMDGKKDN